MKQLEPEYEQFHMDLSNGYTSKDREHPQNISNAYRQIEYFKLVFVPRKKSDEGSSLQSGNKTKGGDINGDQHMSDSSKQYLYFKCGCFKPDYIGAKQCKFTSKLNGSPVNNQEIINKKFEKLKKAKKRTSSSPTTSST